MLTGDREIELLNLLQAIGEMLEKSVEQQEKMVQALERLAEAFTDVPEEPGELSPVPSRV